MKLSIIIPCYNAEPYIDELLKGLLPQITDDVEVIVVDDGSKKPYKNDKVKVIRQKNQGASFARNRGLDEAQGEYIAFIDADDLVSNDYVEKILAKTESNFDVLEFSWKTVGNGNFMDYKLKSAESRLSNPSVCTRVFRKAFIGKTRFTKYKDACEDEDFSRRLGYLDAEKKFKREVITDYLYFYRNYVADSNTKRYKQGLCNTKRITYYYNHVTADQTDLLEEIKREDKYNEVWLLTNKCDIIEMKKYCQIHTPTWIWTHVLRGEPYSNCEIINVPMKTQVVLYINQLYLAGGIETFVYDYAKTMGKYYDMALLVGNIPEKQFAKINSVIPVIKDKRNPIVCDTLIVLRILDDVPKYVQAKQTIRMCHGCKTNPKWEIKKDCDKVVFVSQIAKDSFNEVGEVIHNPFYNEGKKALFLISATRIPAPDKGNNEKRMFLFAEMLNKAKIPFIWLNFSDGKIENAPKGLYNMGIDMDIQPYIAKADYLVQLSDSEAYSYSILEALTNNTAVICTPFPSAEESGVVDGENGYIIPFDMGFDVKKLLKVPKFKDNHANDEIIGKWREVLGDSKPISPYKPSETVMIRALRDYNDTKQNRNVKYGEIYEVPQERANVIINAGFAERI